MPITEYLRDLFSILHDGKIGRAVGSKDKLTLPIECRYLAERINRSYTFFFIEFINVDTLHFTAWPNPASMPVLHLTEIADIFKSDLEILSAELSGEQVAIACNQQDTSFPYSGGNLTLSCESVKIYDQNKKELTLDDLDNICKRYWADMGREIEKRLMASRTPTNGEDN